MRPGKDRLGSYLKDTRHSFSWGRFLLTAVACDVAYAALVWLAALGIRRFSDGPITYDNRALSFFILTICVLAGLVAGAGATVAPRATLPRPKPWTPPVLVAALGTTVIAGVLLLVFPVRQSGGALVLWQIANGLVVAVFVGIGAAMVKAPEAPQ